MKTYESEIDYRYLFWIGCVITLVGLVLMVFVAKAELQIPIAERPGPGYLMKAVAAGLLSLLGSTVVVLAYNREKLLRLRKEHETKQRLVNDYGALLCELVDQEFIDRLLSDAARKSADAEAAVRDFPENWSARPGVKTEADFDREYKALKEQRLHAIQHFGWLAGLIVRVGRELGTNWQTRPKEEHLKEEQKQAS